MGLNAFQREVQKLARSMGLKGDAERQVYSTPEYEQLLESFFGKVPLPPGVDPSQVVSQTPRELVYRDEHGYTHQLARNLDGSSPDLGRVMADNTDRPAVLPASQQIPGTENAIQQALSVLGGVFGGGNNPGGGDGQFFGLPTNTNPQGTAITNGAVTGGFQGTGALGNLSLADKALLDQITQATLSQLDQQYTQQGGRLVAELYGRGMNESTLANDALTRLQQGQYLGREQVLSDAATRELDIRKYLTDLSTKSALDLFNSIMGNETTRSVSSGQIGLGREQLSQQSLDSSRQFQLAQEQLELQKKAQSQSPWKSILSAVASLGAAAIPGIGPFIAPVIGGAISGSGKTTATGSYPTITF